MTAVTHFIRFLVLPFIPRQPLTVFSDPPYPMLSFLRLSSRRSVFKQITRTRLTDCRTTLPTFALPLQLIHQQTRRMSTQSTTSNGVPPSNTSNAVALTASPPTNAPTFDGTADSGSEFESVEPKKPITYIAFHPTHEWQVVEENHLLPPGLWIQMDFDGKTQARLQPVKLTAEEQRLAQQPKKDSEEEKTETQSETKETTTESTTTTTGTITTEISSLTITDSSSAPNLNHKSKTSLTTPASVPCQQKRSLSTTTKKSYSHVSRLPLLPVYPTPTPEFLAARTPLPKSDVPIISIAPMVDVTDRHFRYLMRLISKHVVLYTPMLVDNALLRAPLAYPLYIEHLPVEHPVIAQLGGSEPDLLVRAALICQAQGFQQININVGCPAPSASGHAYGCILMGNKEFPKTVRKVVDAVSIPVTIKCRIGLNREESFEYFENFIKQCHEVGGVNHFIVHARKGVLNLKTAKNLTVPPLKYDFVYELKKRYPHLHIQINGGFDSWEVVKEQVTTHGLQGVMLGRHAWKNPYDFVHIDRIFHGCTKPIPTRMEIMEQYLQYIERVYEENQTLWREYESKKKELEEIEAKEDAEKALHTNSQPTIAHNITASTCSSTSTAAISSSTPHNWRPSELLPPPLVLDIRQLLRPVGYLYANEPGYKAFRKLFEDGMAHHKERSMREIVTRAMTAVEPPPVRDMEWAPYHHTDEKPTSSTASVHPTSDQPIEEGKEATTTASSTIPVSDVMATIDGEASCPAADNTSTMSNSSAAPPLPLIHPTSSSTTVASTM